MAEITNADRAAWAEDALDTFKAVSSCDEDDLANIKDLITDLLHLARRKHSVEGEDLYTLARLAADMHRVEQVEDQEE